MGQVTIAQLLNISLDVVGPWHALRVSLAGVKP
jgi:hypothetical protein